jgi:hypothetical protein
MLDAILAKLKSFFAFIAAIFFTKFTAFYFAFSTIHSTLSSKTLKEFSTSMIKDFFVFVSYFVLKDIAIESSIEIFLYLAYSVLFFHVFNRVETVLYTDSNSTTLNMLKNIFKKFNAIFKK